VDAESPGSFVPTVTAISSTPDLQWMVQPTVITSGSPSLGRAESNEPAKSKTAGSKGKCAGRKSKSEQVFLRVHCMSGTRAGLCCGCEACACMGWD